VTVYIAIVFAIPVLLSIFSNPLTIFGDAGTLAAFGFLLAYFLITIAAPAYLKKLGELRRRHVVMAVAACLCLMVPTIGSFYPMPPYPVVLFPYIYLAWMLVGAGWLYLVNRRNPGTNASIEADLDRAIDPLEEHVVELPEVTPVPVMAYTIDI
jgi:amino acid transporter